MARVLEGIAAAVSADDDGVALTQSVATNGNYVLVAGAASFAAAQIEFDSSADESASTIEITGKLAGSGLTYTEYVQGPTASINARTQARFTAIYSARQLFAATVGSVKIGWAATQYSRWLFAANDQKNYTHMVRVFLAGTATYDLQATTQAMNRDPAYIKGRDPDDIIALQAAISTNYYSGYLIPFQAYRIRVTASSANVTLRLSKSITG